MTDTPDAAHKFSVTDWPSRNDRAPILQFMPHPVRGCLLAATIDEQPLGVRITVSQAAFLAVELTRAVGLQPPIELENLARSDALGAPAEVTTQEAVPDPRDGLLRAAFEALSPAAGAIQQMSVAHAIAGYLLGSAPTQQEAR